MKKTGKKEASPAAGGPALIWILPGIFLAAVFSTPLWWNAIALPYQNPYGVVGLCVKQHLNPNSDILRFLVFLALPTLFMFLAYFGFGRKAREAVFTPFRSAGEKEQGGAPGHWTLWLSGYALLIALNIPTYHAFGRFSFYFEGETLGTSVSYLHGQVPYKDFLFFHGLFEDPLRSVLAFKWFGRSISAIRTLVSILKLATWLLIALCLKELFPNRPLRAFGVMTFLALVQMSFLFVLLVSPFLPKLSPDAMAAEFLKFQPFLGHFEFSIVPARDAIVFLFLYAFLRLTAFWKGRAGFPRVSAFVFSFLPFFSLAIAADRGVYMTAAYLFLFPAAYFLHVRGRPREGGFLALSGAGVAAAFGTMGVLFRGGEGDFFRYTFGVMPFYKELSEKIPFPIGQWNIFLMCCLVAGHLYFLTYRFLQTRGRFAFFLREHFLETGLFILGALFFRSALERSDWEHVIYGDHVLLILTAVVLLKNGPWGALAGKKGSAVLAKGLPVLVALVVLLCGVRMARYDVLGKNFPLGVPDEAWLDDGQRATVAFLKEKTAHGDGFFTMTSEAAWYYFLDQPCPTRFPYVFVGAPEAYQEEMARDLDDKKVKYVLYRNADWSYRIDGIGNEERFPILARFIRERYKPFRTIAGNEIWVLKQGS